MIILKTFQEDLGIMNLNQGKLFRFENGRKQKENEGWEGNLGNDDKDTRSCVWSNCRSLLFVSMIKGYLLKQPKRNPRPRGERHQRSAEKAQDGRNVCVPKCHKLALFVVIYLASAWL